MTRRRPLPGTAAAVVVASVLLLASCGGDATKPTTSDASGPVTSEPAATEPGDSTPGEGPVTITLLAHDSFVTSDGIFDELTERTGITVEVATSGDAGTMLAKAALTAGNPEGDVMWGVDNTLLSRAVRDEVFEPYASPGLAGLPAEVTDLVTGHEATPVDTGDVCVNYDVAALQEAGVEPPADLQALTDPQYRDMLVVQSPASSSPGLAFLLATVAEFGDDGWQEYWSALRDNGVQVVDSWTDAYYGAFSRAGGDRPLVVSYASSPPAEVLYADPPLEEGAPAPTGVVTATCFRQVEFAGVLRGTDHPEAARQVIDYLIGATFQSDLPLNQFVDPVNPDAVIPALYAQHVVRPEASLSLDPAVIDEHREEWVDEWTTVTLR